MGAAAGPQIDAPLRAMPGRARRAATKCRLPEFQSGAPPKRTGRHWAAWLIAVMAFLGAASGWLLVVQDIPPRTAFIFFADAYPAPFAPPGWIDEDRDRFRSLDGQSLQFESTGFGCRMSGSLWDGLDAAILATQSQIDRSGVLFVDVRGQGAVDSQGQPALIPPTADPFEPSTWVPCDAFCRRIQSAAPSARQIILVLDCLPARTHWSAGLLDNGFPAAVESWAARPGVAEEFPRLTILCRGGDGESRWRSRVQHGSTLQEALWLGLAGAADTSGNADQRVQLSELIEYIRRTLPHRDQVTAHQFGTTNVLLAQALPSDRQRELQRQQSARIENAAAASLGGLQTAWQQCGQLLNNREWQDDLPAASRLLRALAWWEANLWSGQAGEAESAATTREVTRWLSFLSRPSEANVLPPGEYPYLELQRHSGLPSHQFDMAIAQWNSLAQTGNRDAFTTQVQSLAASDPLRITSLRQMASLLARNAPAESWRQPLAIQRTLKQRQQYEALAVPEDIRASRHLIAQLGPLRDLNLAAFDALQIGSPAESVTNILDRGDQLVLSCTDNANAIQQQLVLCDRVRLELPFLAEWAAGRDARATTEKDYIVNRTLLPLIAALSELDQRLHFEMTGEDKFTALAAAVERDWLVLRGQFESEWDRLLNLRTLKPDDLDALEALLSAPLLTRTDDAQSRSPAEQRIELLRKLFSLQQKPANDPEATQVSHPGQQMLNRWNAHPALMLVESPTKTSSQPVRTLEAWNHQFRQSIRGIEQQEATAASVQDTDDAAARHLL
ncbi:MAG: hypothetical protein KF861_17690, partial [Planctomycetaceae bacterium]|nr:hypothetical protein [Planctomycetaceae bacterium]